jgi:hypothetical protein
MSDEAPSVPLRRPPLRHPPAVYWRRRAIAVAALVALVIAAVLVAGALGGEDDPAAGASAEAQQPTPAQPPPPPELPRGGRDLLPRYRIVAFYGAPQADELGTLGIGTPAQAVARLERQMAPYDRPDRPVMPALELIATVAAAHPGADGRYRMRQEHSVIRRYLRAARAAKALLVLDIQPGMSDFLTETRRLRRWLREPDVGLALDPEWRVQAGQVPGTVIGSVTAAEVNATSRWLAALTRRRNLPQKLFLIHQFTFDMISDRQTLARRPELAMVLNADGFGTRAQKKQKYRAFVKDRRFLNGFKLFYNEDTDLMPPRAVMRLRPPPDVVIYE